MAVNNTNTSTAIDMACGSGRNLPMLLSHFKMVDIMEPADELRNKAKALYGEYLRFGVPYAETF